MNFSLTPSPLFEKGGPVMWPLLLTSLIALAIILERVVFILNEKRKTRPEAVKQLLRLVHQGHIDRAIHMGKAYQDFVVQALIYGLENRNKSLSDALMRACSYQLKRFNAGIVILDTAITLAPLLGLLATVTGMITAFGALGNQELSAPSVITGGIAEALIGTAFGLAIAICAVLPFNYLNARIEDAKHQLEDAATHLELLLKGEQKDSEMHLEAETVDIAVENRAGSPPKTGERPKEIPPARKATENVSPALNPAAKALEQKASTKTPQVGKEEKVEKVEELA